MSDLSSLLLLYYLIDNGHEVLQGKGSAEDLRERMRQAAEREYPEQENDLPEEKRQGTIPKSIIEVVRAMEAESNAGGSGEKRP